MARSGHVCRFDRNMIDINKNPVKPPQAEKYQCVHSHLTICSHDHGIPPGNEALGGPMNLFRNSIMNCCITSIIHSPTSKQPTNTINTTHTLNQKRPICLANALFVISQFICPSTSLSLSSSYNFR